MNGENDLKYSDVHIESCKKFFTEVIPKIPQLMHTFLIELDTNKHLLVTLKKLVLSKKTYETCAECFISGNSYTRDLKAHFEIEDVEKKEKKIHKVSLGEIPMYTHNKDHTVGGTFIINGNEKICRLGYGLKRNMIFKRKLSKSSSFQKENLHSKFILTKVSNGHNSIINRFFISKDNNEILYHFVNIKINICMMLYCLCSTNDKEIFLNVMPNSLIQIDVLKSTLENNKVKSRKGNYHIMSEIIKAQFGMEFFSGSPEQIVSRFLRKYLFPHLDTHRKKFSYLIFVIKKLLNYYTSNISSMSLSDDHVEVDDNIDILPNLEVQTPSVVLSELFRSCLLHRLASTKVIVESWSVSKRNKSFSAIFERKFASFGDEIQRVFATGEIPYYRNYPAVLSQHSGVFIPVEKTNFLRYQAFFRAIHRGRQFVDSKLTTVRKFLPSNWGFLCPINTPDGTQCGLLNHLSGACKVTYRNESIDDILSILIENEEFLSVSMYAKCPRGFSFVLVNHCVCGYIMNLHKLERDLRIVKCSGIIPHDCEIIIKGDYIEINTYECRMIRPVLNKMKKKVEWISPAEQPLMNIALKTHKKNFQKMIDEGIDNDEDDDEEEEGENGDVIMKDNNNNNIEMKMKFYTHEEIDNIKFLSNIANTVPFSNFNQSPRNVYQCQMAKQSLGFPFAFNFHDSCENVTYGLDVVQKALAQTSTEQKELQGTYVGINAVVAVLSYTGYDMEDALIINKSSFERGIFSGTVYKTERVDLSDREEIFSNANRDDEGNVIEPFEQYYKSTKIGIDGLPLIGSKFEKGEVYAIVYDQKSRTFGRKKWAKGESTLIDNVIVLSKYQVNIKHRFSRRPVVGDKFASRHGQKGILSFLWPEEDMPFSENGIRPDVIINPHAFPSRMTIGMMMEMIASKDSAMRWKKCNDATSFKFDEQNLFLKNFGKKLVENGFNFYGNEMLYSGYKGTPFKADIFMGICFYQRLKHMVEDKYQVRTKGTVDIRTQQPLKGRKRGGGIRLGEMERDCLLSYGSSFLLKDRMFHCSDESYAVLCQGCGNIFSQVDDECKVCKNGSKLKVIEVPYVFKYLVNELVFMNIKLKCK